MPPQGPGAHGRQGPPGSREGPPRRLSYSSRQKARTADITSWASVRSVWVLGIPRARLARGLHLYGPSQGIRPLDNVLGVAAPEVFDCACGQEAGVRAAGGCSFLGRLLASRAPPVAGSAWPGRTLAMPPAAPPRARALPRSGGLVLRGGDLRPQAALDGCGFGVAREEAALHVAAAGGHCHVPGNVKEDWQGQADQDLVRPDQLGVRHAAGSDTLSQGPWQGGLGDQEGVHPVPAPLECGGHVLHAACRRPLGPRRSAPRPGWWWRPCRRWCRRR